MSARGLDAFFEAHKSTGEDLVLATVYETLGATYSKIGARMLINGSGDFQGMLSGGCLEGDLAERARQVIADGNAQRVTYDLREDDDTLWGLGVGCEGLMRILLQPLKANDGYRPFPALMRVLKGERRGIALTVVESDDPATQLGATLIGEALPLENFAVAGAAATRMSDLFLPAFEAGRSTLESCESDGCSLQVLCAQLRPPPRILVLGGGLDAQPVVGFCHDLGWRVTLQDHRPAYIEKGCFSDAENVLSVPADTLAESLDLNAFDAAVVMSHHLVTDLSYLKQLAVADIAYVGLLGPRTRRARLLKQLGASATRFDGRLHGPAGLDIGGRGPASIALSILAQMHQVLIRERDD